MQTRKDEGRRLSRKTRDQFVVKHRLLQAIKEDSQAVSNDFSRQFVTLSQRIVPPQSGAETVSRSALGRWLALPSCACPACPLHTGKRAAAGRESRSCTISKEELRLQALFKLFDLFAQCRLRDVQANRSPVHAAFFSDRNEIVQVTELWALLHSPPTLLLW